MNQKTQLIYHDLKSRYKKATLSKAELANELGISSSTIDRNMKEGIGIPNYRKLGNARNSKVIFNIVEVAEFLSQTVKVAQGESTHHNKIF